MTHPFDLPGPEGQAARDAAKPMAPRVGERVMQRCGKVFKITSREHCHMWISSGGRHVLSLPELDIIAAVDAEERVVRTAEGEVEPAASPGVTAGALTGIWPDFIAPSKYEAPDPRWTDPGLPDFRLIWKLARDKGYAVGLHGSMKRDCDMIAAPWVADAAGAEDLIAHLCAGLNADLISVKNDQPKPHGRQAFILQIRDAYKKAIDISVMPALAPGARVVTAEQMQEVVTMRRDIIFMFDWIEKHLIPMNRDIPDEQRAALADDMCSDWFGSGVGASLAETVAAMRQIAEGGK